MSRIFLLLATVNMDYYCCSCNSSNSSLFRGRICYWSTDSFYVEYVRHNFI